MKTMKQLKEAFSITMAFALLTAMTPSYGSIATPSPTKEEVASMKKIVGYYPEWGIYSGHGYYNPGDMAIGKMTHINYAFATIVDGEIAEFDTWAASGVASQFGEDWDSEYKGALGQFKKFEAQYPNTSFMISIGGWTQSGNFHDVAATPEARQKFADSVVAFVRKWHFDGVDIDWEYPAVARDPDTVDNINDQGTPKADATETETFTLLLKDLRAALDAAGLEDSTYYQLTAAVSANLPYIDLTKPSEYAQYLDFINLMTYDMHGAWDAVTNHQSALYSNPHAGVTANSIDNTVNHFLGKGVSASKLVIGSPFYSRGWKGVQKTGPLSQYPGLFTTANGGADGIWDGGRAAGNNPYWKIKEMEQDTAFTKYYDEYAQAPYLYSESKGEMYTYEDTQSLGQKVAYVNQHGLGGIIFWEVTGDAPLKGTELLDVIYSGFYEGEIPPVDDPPTDDPPADDPPANVAAWDPNTVYTGGEIVSHNGKNWQAQWWTQGNEPGTEEWGPWQEYTGDIEDPPADDPPVDDPPVDDPPANIVAWDSNTVYTGGEIVSHNGQHWQAQWWTQGNEPGTEQWGPWAEYTGNGDDGTGDDGTGDDGTGYRVTQDELTAKEESLTNSLEMVLVKESIRTLDNQEVEQIVPLRAENPSNVKRVESLMSEADFNYLFPNRLAQYTYINFLKAAGKFPAFCGDYTDGRDADQICRKSLATMFAHFAQETGGHNPGDSVPEWQQALMYVREMGWAEEDRGGYNAECNPDVWQGQAWPCGTFSDTGEFKSYFGRGAKQVSYNYNYGPFSQAMTGSVHTLLDNPELVADTWLNFASAVWFFTYPQPPKPSMLHVIDGTWQPNDHDISNNRVPGFGVSTMIMNGGVECGGSVEHQQSLNRISYYHEFADFFNVEVPNDEVLGCAAMPYFDEGSSSVLDIYWEQDWSYVAENPEGKSYACKLVGYQTAYSAFLPGDYTKCVVKYFPDIVIE